ncbi:MAG TPA: GNAT family N-acetyltransferase [Vicinamibacteria bacterium]|nr:GNAT family N-acetyltransferase [Vicinamibacteria bacterium]
MATEEVRRTYLEMTAPGDLRPARSQEPGLSLQRVEGCPPSLYRFLYSEVGRAYRWVDRLDWTDAQIDAHLGDPAVSLWLLTAPGGPAGYFELRQDRDAVEIAYFGLLPEFIGRGLGKHMLTEAVERAWGLGARRVWLHTCSLDGPAALPNYLARGFRPFREETYLVTAPG